MTWMINHNGCHKVLVPFELIYKYTLFGYKNINYGAGMEKEIDLKYNMKQLLSSQYEMMPSSAVFAVEHIMQMVEDAGYRLYHPKQELDVNKVAEILGIKELDTNMDSCIEGIKPQTATEIQAYFSSKESVRRVLINKAKLICATFSLPSIENIDIELICVEVHKAYCQSRIDQGRDPYWTNGDYFRLSDREKEIDRYTVRAVLKAIHTEIEKRRK